MNKKIMYSILGLALVLTACVREPAEDVSIEIVADRAEGSIIAAGETVVFSITADAEFVTFFAGTPGTSPSDYPKVIAQPITLVDGKAEVRQRYFYHGEIKPVVKAFSYGNWASDEKTEMRSLAFTGIDYRTLILSASIRKNAFAKSYTGVIDAENGTVTFVDVPDNQFPTVLTFSLESTVAKAYIGDEEITSPRASFNITDGFKIKVVAASGDIKEWSVLRTNSN
jgi:hypothetical protein